MNDHEGTRRESLQMIIENQYPASLLVSLHFHYSLNEISHY